MSKTLYFDGAGCSYNANKESDIGNYRIRTAFLNNEGKAIYLELGGHDFNEKGKGSYWKSHIDHVFYIVENEKDKKYLYPTNNMQGYTKEKLVKWVNENLNCSFETMEVLDDMEGYRVHADNRGYNLMDNHIINRERTQARKEAYKEVDAYFRQKLNEKYSTISLMEMNENDIKIRCHASIQSLNKAGLTEEDRIKIIPINY